MKNKFITILACIGVLTLAGSAAVANVRTSPARSSVFDQLVVDDIVADLAQKSQINRNLESLFWFAPQASLYFKGRADLCDEEILVLDSRYSLSDR